MQEPTPLTDPAGYLSLLKFNRKLRKCPRTGLSVSYADVGDPDGIPILFVPPSGCSRWFAAPQDPLALGYGIRLIVVDRPGVGAVPMVPLKERIDVSCKHIVSVLEHLGVTPAHMVATSAGIYCALHLLSAHPSIFLTGLNPPPAVYLVSPWSPPLPSTDPLAYRQLLDWIPDSLITTQDLTLPYVIPAVKTAEEAYGSASRAVGAAVESVSKWWSGIAGSKNSGDAEAASTQASSEIGEEAEKLSAREEDGIPVPDSSAQDTEEEAKPRKRLWAKSAKYLTMDYLYAEDFRGIGQEHMMCLNRGSGTGPEWFIKEIMAVSDAVRAAQSDTQPTNEGESADEIKPTKVPHRLEINTWWGGLDGMVPKNGQEWLNKVLSAHPTTIRYAAHFVKDGSHGDLMLRAQGIGEVYTAIMLRGNTTSPEEAAEAETI